MPLSKRPLQRREPRSTAARALNKRPRRVPMAASDTVIGGIDGSTNFEDCEDDEFMGIYASATPPADSTGAALRMMATAAMTTTMNKSGPSHHELGGDSDRTTSGCWAATSTSSYGSDLRS